MRKYMRGRQRKRKGSKKRGARETERTHVRLTESESYREKECESGKSDRERGKESRDRQRKKGREKGREKTRGHEEIHVCMNVFTCPSGSILMSMCISVNAYYISEYMNICLNVRKYLYIGQSPPSPHTQA